MSVIRIALPVPLRQSFDYLLPAGIEVQVGCRVRVPFGKRALVGIVWQLQPADAFAEDALKPIIEPLDAAPVLSEHLCQLLSFAADYYHHPLGEVLISAIPALLREGKPLPTGQSLSYQLTQAGETTAEADLKRAPKQLALWQQLQQGALAADSITSEQRPALRALLQKQLVTAIEVPFAPYPALTAASAGLKLTTDQALAVSAIVQAQGRFQPFLLEGITGSGKTEVYLQSIAPLLAQGQQVLVLVPEIGLTPQTLARFADRFAVPVLSWHSGLTDTERLGCWQQAATGSAAIVIGTRSALFLRFARLGLIVVDEEHDASLKQQDGFRYHARDLAIKRAALEQCPVVLGSATPSLESLHNALQGRFQLLTLSSRASGQQLPTLELINLQQQPVQFGLANTTIQQIKHTLQQGFQVMLFLNRRGFAPALSCQECGWVADCQRCDASMTWHKSDRQLNCHHCGSSRPVPRQCGHCGSTRLVPLGQGTEQLEAQLQPMFPDYPVVRLDRDSTRRKGSLAEALHQITQGGPQLIVGTQMLAKGHHFPQVTLVVIVDVDGALFSSDFRAPEQLAQLITQVAGRAGRARHAGKVLLQSRYPDHGMLQDILHNGYDSFARLALTERQQTLLPPYQFLALFRAESHQDELPRQWLQQLVELVQTEAPEVQLLGPIRAPLERKAGKYRWQLHCYSASRSGLHQLLNQLIAASQSWPLTRKLRWQLDVDPVDLS
ncbi:primosomal protein N' [Alkalimonas amylolytica]|uniref:Replication restart protein PriA n=1 Tax=Alkalimonas amylolytica TaxID=152573 RepID=A0A1H3Y116_ALKAM|nr:primosomal protein N' [Alkalimonas amylolytica]SEA04502.1 replication restart DNA helicase PriA [Alkalimonas amylolytica]